ncbi:hypothetical protein ACE3MQ_21150 [Paenibacillus lentus]|uniref:hypothetical protein n=1 Tax=Paenibacillus lentus TaxID=1338368 RepID=UPI00365622D3
MQDRMPGNSPGFMKVAEGCGRPIAVMQHLGEAASSMKSGENGQQVCLIQRNNLIRKK